MRTALLISFFICLFLHFTTRDKTSPEVDSVNITQAAVKKIELTPVSKKILPLENEIVASASPENLPPQESPIDSEEILAEEDDNDLAQLPWSDIEEGWTNHLREFLTGLDPERAEEMLSAYLEEKKKYREKVDFAETANVERSPAVVEDDLVSGDASEDEPEKRHQENLKEIFGDYYSQVESLHKEYVESVQYLNRSSANFTLSL